MAETEAFWRGEFGSAYSQRNANGMPSALAFWSRVLAKTQYVRSVVELGANIGTNLRAIRQLLPGAETAGVEINAQAAEALRMRAHTVFEESILDWQPDTQRDLAFTRGVLIHIAPEDLPKAYAKLYEASKRYVVIAEYYNPVPVEVEYRGHAGRLWKRDFAGEFMDAYGLTLLDYGFVWRRDPNWPQDDITYFVMEKRS